jgi:hypothetical protein
MKRLAVYLLGIALLALGGCTTVSTSSMQRPVHMVRAEGITIGDLLVMLNSGRSQSEIVTEIKTKGLRSTPSASDLDVLSQNGATKEVIDAVVAGGQQFPTTAATDPNVTTTTTYYGGPGWWPYVGFSYWSGYPYGYYYGPGFYRPSFYGSYGSYYSRPYVNSYRGPSGAVTVLPRPGGGVFSSPYRSAAPRAIFRRR